MSNQLRECFRYPIPAVWDAVRYLDASVSAHQAGHHELAEQLIRLADMPEVRDWTESIWGKESPYVKFREVVGSPDFVPEEKRAPLRMLTAENKRELIARDGYYCRFCGVPVIRVEVRNVIRKLYPEALRWGETNIGQHAAFQALWLQYDHVVPYSRGGTGELSNFVITCAPCNFGRMDKLVEEVGLYDPRDREPRFSTWDGLERILC